MKFNTLQFKRGSTSEWNSANLILASGEPGFDYSANTLKIGDGDSPWSVLPAIQADPLANATLTSYSDLSTVPSPYVGMMVLSTSDNLPVWYDGTNWKDFAGNIV